MINFTKTRYCINNLFTRRLLRHCPMPPRPARSRSPFSSLIDTHSRKRRLITILYKALPLLINPELIRTLYYCERTARETRDIRIDATDRNPKIARSSVSRRNDTIVPSCTFALPLTYIKDPPVTIHFRKIVILVCE